MMNSEHDFATVYRRQTLVLAGSTLAVALAGCSAVSPSGGDDGEGDETPSGESEKSDTDSDEPRLRLRGDLVGTMATGITVPPDETTAIEAIVATELDIDRFDVRAREDVVEVYDDVTADAFVAALESTSVDGTAASIQPGVSNWTRDQMRDAITSRLDAAGIGDTAVEMVETDEGYAAVVEIFDSGAESARVESLLATRGTVTVVASYPTDSGRDEQRLLTQSDFASVGQAQPGNGRQPPHVPATLTETSAKEFSRMLAQHGFTSEGVGSCGFDTDEDEPPVDDGWCLYTAIDGDVVYAAGLSPGLADTISSGEFTENPQFILTAQNYERAQRLEQYLRSGPLPAPLESVSLE